MSVLGFWGLHVKAERKYAQEVDVPFRVAMASFGQNVTGEERCSVIVEVDGKQFVLCNLTPGKLEQQPLDLVFSTGEELSFYATGKNDVYLTGNYVTESTDEFSDEDEEEEDEEFDEEDLDDLTDEQKEELKKLISGMDEDESEEEEEEEKKEEEKPAPKKKAKENAKRKAAEVEAEKVVAEPVEKSKKAKKEKKAKEEKKESAPARQELPNGLIIEDIEVGKGPKAVKGKNVSMRYIGRLMNGKVFDQNTKGKAFRFRLGAGQVIKGWDIGVDGMLTNGKRRLTIPAKLAYGSRGAPPDIPPNATLQFDVQLVNVA
ncbi:hypothetical protein THASP1DRAFT_27600 [Thamnocephalis sphaerospora]|uniref:peptidylprolyl isomerase n=1 Tax=Thamnocephalis sphaerospora TaxID=78915 RepID=A0A4P9XWC7_9FUNG|nr:hypothetical protein THASP1DRAFT_27600 [Thamnocephalis sphaerospora]|eukprot:RKP10633.1 hypothetical protein THASP1DRAFT_27600 [Thamnocephalis sphaerospora]